MKAIITDITGRKHKVTIVTVTDYKALVIIAKSIGVKDSNLHDVAYDYKGKRIYINPNYIVSVEISGEFKGNGAVV